MTIFWLVETGINLFLQGLGSWLTPIMHAFSFLGQEEFYLLIMSALYWCVDSALGIRVGITLLASNAINASLKLAFHGARPYWLDRNIHAIASETSYGFPSGHAQNAVAVWGQIALNVRKVWMTILSIILILMIGISRLYLGVHFFSDVLGGWIIGFLLLFIINNIEKPVLKWWSGLSLGRQAIVAVLTSLLIPLTAWIILSMRGNWVLPQSWINNALASAPDNPIAPDTLSGVVSLAGTWLGLLVGIALTDKSGGFSAQGSGRQKILRYVIGVLGVIILWYGLGMFFPRGETLLPYILRYLRYGLTGAWITFGAVWVFRKFNLVHKINNNS